MPLLHLARRRPRAALAALGVLMVLLLAACKPSASPTEVPPTLPSPSASVSTAPAPVEAAAPAASAPAESAAAAAASAAAAETEYARVVKEEGSRERLTMSKRDSKSGSIEEQARAGRDSAARQAELSRQVEELKRLQQQGQQQQASARVPESGAVAPAAAPKPAPPAAASAISKPPAFPWPPPRASAQRVLPPEQLLRAGTAPTLGDVAQRLAGALDRAGYGSRSFYSVPGGFAIATQLERIRGDGQPEPGSSRWLQSQPPSFTLVSYLQSLVDARPGHFRVIVLLVTDETVVALGAAPTRSAADSWVSSGASTLPAAIGGRPVTPALNCTALIYEFAKPPGGSATLKVPAEISGERHLQGSGLMAALAS